MEVPPRAFKVILEIFENLTPSVVPPPLGKGKTPEAGLSQAFRV